MSVAEGRDGRDRSCAGRRNPRGWNLSSSGQGHATRRRSRPRSSIRRGAAETRRRDSRRWQGSRRQSNWDAKRMSPDRVGWEMQDANRGSGVGQPSVHPSRCGGQGYVLRNHRRDHEPSSRFTTETADCHTCHSYCTAVHAELHTRRVVLSHVNHRPLSRLVDMIIIQLEERYTSAALRGPLSTRVSVDELPTRATVLIQYHIVHSLGDPSLPVPGYVGMANNTTTT